jgi:hypothetical protein
MLAEIGDKKPRIRGSMMKKIILTASVALLLSSSLASAADMDREIGLIVSGVVDQWAGVQLINDSFLYDDDAVFTNGSSGSLSLPLGTNLSIQSDFKYEVNTYATESVAKNDAYGPRYSYQGAGHLSWRDPAQGLFGMFGGVGSTAFSGFINSGGAKSDIAFVGGEAQVYLDNITVYAQGGYVDFDAKSPTRFDTLNDGLFARGVLRWFLENGSRLQFEGTYANIDREVAGDVDIFSAGARYDFSLSSLPMIGAADLFVAYRGTFRNDCSFDTDVNDHTFMVGFSYAFSGDRLTIDRQGATLDTPDFNHNCATRGARQLQPD